MKNGCSRILMVGFAFAQMVLSGLSSGAGDTYWVTGTGDANDVLDGVMTLREAVAAADHGDVVRFGAGMEGAEIRLVNGEISVGKSIVIEGFALGRPQVLPAKANPERLFSVEPGTVVTMRHLVFRDGVADQGGAIHSEGDLTIEFCRFEDNEATVMGGAIFHRTRSLEMAGCLFEGNKAPRAGAVAVTGMAFCNVEGCVFRENVSDDTLNTSLSGGAIFSQESQLGIQDSRFEENVAEGNGVALAVERGDVFVQSSVFAGNASPPAQVKPGASISLLEVDGFFSGNAIYGGTGRGLISQNGEPLVMKNCTIAGNAGGGISTLNNDLILENGLIWGNAGSTLRVTGTGELTATYSLVEGQDLTGQGSGNFDGTNPWVDPGFGPEIDPARAPFVDGDLTPRFESVVVDAGTVNAGGVAEDLAGNPRVRGLGIDLGAYEQQKVILHVDQNAPVAGADGLTWATAFPFLNDALEASLPGDELHLAEGRYRPDQGAGQTAGEVISIFEVPHSLTMMGGYPTGGGFRDPGEHLTVLSGDLAGDDLAGAGFTRETANIRGENAHGLLVANWGQGSESELIVDGVTFTASSTTDNVGNLGALVATGGSHIIRNCYFVGCGRTITGSAGAEVSIRGGEVSGCGGGSRFLYLADGEVSLRNVFVTGCRGDFYVQDGTLEAVNLIYAGNESAILMNGVGQATLVNVTANANNDAFLSLSTEVSLTMVNSLVWGNRRSVASLAIADLGFSHCVVEGLDLREVGSGNFDGTDPFCNPGFVEYYDYEQAGARMEKRNFVPTNPLFEDAGVMGVNQEELDVEGRPRVDDGVINLGAHERLFAPFDEDDDGIADYWEWRHFEGLGQGPGDDFDGDGISEMAEYLHGLDPLEMNVTTDGWRLVTADEGGEKYQGISYRLNPSARGVLVVEILQSEDLGQEDPWSALEMNGPRAGDRDFERINRSRLPRGSVAREFFQVRIRRQ